MGEAIGSGGPVERGGKAPAAVCHLEVEYRRFLHTTYSLLDLASSVRSEAEWEALPKKLDERVRTLLRDFEVELD